MRFYDINITGADGKTVTMASGMPARFTSFVNGITDTGALDIEFDVSVAALDAPINNPYIRIYGVSLQDIGQANDLNGKFITMSVGMQKGLPLANPAQIGQIFSGSVFFAFGNWQGTNQTLDLILNAVQPVATTAAPNNIVWLWPANTPMAQALAVTFKGAFPTMPQSINISPKLVMPSNETGYYKTIDQFASYIKETSLHILGNTQNYPGVSIAVVNGVLTAYDGTTPASTASGGSTFLRPNTPTAGTADNPAQIQFTDLIGQPTWSGPVELSSNLVMRGDLKVGNYLKMPTGLQNLAAITTANSLPQFRDKSVFNGTFLINAIRHVGRFRQPDGSSWVTVVNLLLQL